MRFKKWFVGMIAISVLVGLGSWPVFSAPTINTKKPSLQVAKNWKLSYEGKELNLDLRTMIEMVDDEETEQLYVPLSFFSSALGLKQKGNAFSGKGKSVRFSDDYKWMKYQSGDTLRTLPVQVMKVNQTMFISLRKMAETVGLKIQFKGRTANVFKPTPPPTPNPSATPNATASLNPTATAKSGTETSATPSATQADSNANSQSTAVPNSNHSELNALKKEIESLKKDNASLKKQNEDLKQQIQMLTIQMQTLKTQNMISF